jgi:hypothetical protein
MKKDLENKGEDKKWLTLIKHKELAQEKLHST